jgi:hypothetical protein
MKNLQFNKLFLLTFFLPMQLFAQDITGLWKGEIYVDSTKQYLPFEISISEVKGKLIGYSLITFEENGKRETGLRDVVIDRKGDLVTIDDISLLENSFSIVPPKNIKKKMVVTLTIQDTTIWLSGYWSTNRTRHFLAATGSVELHRKNDYKATALFKKLESLKLADKIAFNEPVKNTETAVTKVLPPTVAVVAKPVEEKMTPPAIVEKPKETATLAPKPVEEKKPTPVVATPPPPQSTTTTVVTKAAEVKSAPSVIKPAVPKAVAPVVAVVSKPIEEKKPATVIEKPAASLPVAAAPAIVEKPKETVAAVEKKPEPTIQPSSLTGAADVNKRTIASTQSVFYTSDSLVLTLYDNGYVDGDTVSVVMNGEVIFSRQGLSTKAVSKTIYITKETPESINLVMYAENLGSIPPNTGLLVVHDGEATYDVRFKADLQSNAAIILTRKKKEN